LFDTVACASYRRLDASIGASEPHDFAVRISTIRPSRANRVHRIPRPTLVTCATPLFRDGTARISELIWVRPEQKYFCKRGWTGQLAKHEVICPSGKIYALRRWGNGPAARQQAARSLQRYMEARFASGLLGAWRNGGRPSN